MKVEVADSEFGPWTALATTDVLVQEPAARAWPITTLKIRGAKPHARITGLHGWNDIPDLIDGACLALAAQYLMLRQGAEGDLDIAGSVEAPLPRFGIVERVLRPYIRAEAV